MRESLIEELKRYVGFTPEDAQTLRVLGPLVDTHLDALTDRFYSQIPAHPEAAEVFTGGEAQIARLRQSLQHWARGLFAGITLKGSTIKADRDANERFYDYPYGSAQLVLEEEPATPHNADAVATWRATLATLAAHTN